MDPNGNMDRPARGAGKRPTDGAPYVLKEGYWYCELCWLYAWGDHMTSTKQLRRLAEHFDEQEDWRQMQTIVGQAALPAPFKGPPPTPPESISSHAGSASGAAASAATPTVGPSTAAASAKMPPPAEPWMPAPPPPPRWPSAQFQGSATISAAKPAAGSGSAGSPQIPGPAIGIAVSATGGLEARLTEMEGRLQEHIGSLHAAVQECHSMIATVQMMQTMVQSSGRNLH